MDSIGRWSRRHLLVTAGSLPWMLGLAGCLGVGDDSRPETDQRATQGPAGDGDDVTPAAPDESEESDLLAPDLEPDYDSWFADVDGFEGTVDRRGHQLVFATLGGETRFDPLALAVDVGTTVDWGWESSVGDHTITHEGGEFDSGTVGFQGFEHRFETPGVYRYFCEFHHDEGMKGAVIVLEE